MFFSKQIGSKKIQFSSTYKKIWVFEKVVLIKVRVSFCYGLLAFRNSRLIAPEFTCSFHLYLPLSGQIEKKGL